jgi:hypothetical protein
MDNTRLRKQLSTFRSPLGVIKNVGNEVYYELLRAWENWTGTSKEFYSSIGVSKSQAAAILGKAKRLQREGAFGAAEFSEVKVGELLPDLAGTGAGTGGPCTAIELNWEGGKVIRFPHVEQLLDFLKKSAA